MDVAKSDAIYDRAYACLTPKSVKVAITSLEESSYFVQKAMTPSEFQLGNRVVVFSDGSCKGKNDCIRGAGITYQCLPFEPNWTDHCLAITGCQDSDQAEMLGIGFALQSGFYKSCSMYSGQLVSQESSHSMCLPEVYIFTDSK